MPKGFLPNPDGGLLAWSLHFKNLLTASPGVYGIDAGRAAGYAVLHDAYAAAYAGVDPAIRSKSAVVAKNEARAKLREEASLLSRTIKGTRGVTDAQKVALGVNVRKRPTAVAAPTVAPGLRVNGVRAWTVDISLYDVASPRRKPVGVFGAAVFTYVGETPPTSLAGWKFWGHTGKYRLEVQFDSGLAMGAQVWLAAFWFNDRKQGGPVCLPVGTRLIGGGVAVAA